nr:immunoglobulin light chain junction region [Macaca mulatta]MOW74926.1 immunoglobulin light chain junction region [Macaca mulatta]
CYQHDSGWTF